MSNMSNREWFKKAGYGMMVHWGLYSLLAGEYDGMKSGHYAEWIQSYHMIPIKEYEKLCSAFNPVFFDAEGWVRFAKECGMHYLVVTSKHHDGFALFKSKADRYNVCDMTPYGKDIIGQLAEASYKHGLKFGLYYSQDIDWHEQHGGGYSTDRLSAGKSWDNCWDFPDRSIKNYDICFENKIKPQVEEILRNYGELCLIWFDVPMTLKEQHSKTLYDLVKKYQPNCLINSRLGNGIYDYVSLGDNEIPESLDSIRGAKKSPFGLYETAATLNDTWGFSYHDQNWKRPEQIAAYRKQLNDLGINYLINVGPDGLGRIPSPSIDILKGAYELFPLLSEEV
ncbi:MAG: Alpha-L-fucosidase [Firmicutes bacterium ADurb.Bin146]|nr:MAG: Alpha-L-fucosidase [Firmicutes bacterium ADurb.Bin146]